MDHSQHAASIFNKYAESYQERFMDVSMYNESLDFLLQELPDNATLLDVACGPANISKYLLDKNTTFSVSGIDLSENMISLAQTNIPSGKFEVMDARDIQKINRKFDVVISGFCFPYLNKEEAVSFIHDSKNCLNNEGLLYLSTMENDYSTSGLERGSKGDEMMMHYHEEGYLKEALINNSFEVLHTHRITTTMTNGKKVVDLIIIARLIADSVLK